MADVAVIAGSAVAVLLVGVVETEMAQFVGVTKCIELQGASFAKPEAMAADDDAISEVEQDITVVGAV